MLILSEFAGASEEMNAALIVNPYDVEMSARAILKALTMTTEERERNVHALRKVVKEHDLYWWLDTFLSEWGIELSSRDWNKGPPSGPSCPLPQRALVGPPPS